MKSYLYLFVGFLFFYKPVFAQQSINASVILAQRGDTISCTYTHNKHINDSTLCNLDFMNFWFSKIGSEEYQIYIPNYYTYRINDSTVKFWFNVSNTLIDGTFSFNGGSYCDTIKIDTAMIVSGGPFTEGFYSISIDTFKRGETKKITIDAKGFNVKNKQVESIRLFGDYYINGSNIMGINDSQLVGNITIPKSIPNGWYMTEIELKGAEPGPKPNSFASLIVYGGKDIPYVDYVYPNTVGRGEEKEIKIHTKGTQFLYEKPYILFGNKELENIVVENDSTIKFKIKVSTGTQDGFNSITLGSYSDGTLVIDSAVEIVGGVPLAKVKLDHEYIVKRGEKVKVLIKGDNTHFRQGGFNLELSRNYPVGIDSAQVIDSITMYAYLSVDEQFLGTGNFGYRSFIYSDAEIFDEIVLENLILVMPDETQGYIVNMEPKFLHYNTTENYTFTIRNVKLSQLNEIDSWRIGAYSILNNQYPDILEFEILNDSMIQVLIRLDEFVTDPIYAIHFEYNLPGGYVRFETFANTIAVNTGNKENKEERVFMLYPNPVSDKLYIETKHQVNNFTIIDISGKQIQVSPNDVEQNGNQFTIPIDKLGLRKGIYFIRLESDSGFDYQKFIVE